MQQPPPSGASTLLTHGLYLTGRQPLHRGAILLASVIAAGALSAVLYGLGHTGHAGLSRNGSGSAGSSSSTAGGEPARDEQDDPSQVDTIVLGDPADAPEPARRGEHVSPVHPTILVHLPRFGDQVGLIPDSPSGRLLYGWLAAFNKASSSALAAALPTLWPATGASAQMVLRQETGGFNLLSAKEVQPGVLVFRLREQNPPETEALGTLQVRLDDKQVVIASFSLRGVPTARADSLSPAR